LGRTDERVNSTRRDGKRWAERRLGFMAAAAEHGQATKRIRNMKF
jgi:hypothetical protein